MAEELAIYYIKRLFRFAALTARSVRGTQCVYVAFKSGRADGFGLFGLVFCLTCSDFSWSPLVPREPAGLHIPT